MLRWRTTSSTLLAFRVDRDGCEALSKYKTQATQDTRCKMQTDQDTRHCTREGAGTANRKSHTFRQRCETDHAFDKKHKCTKAQTQKYRGTETRHHKITKTEFQETRTRKNTRTQKHGNTQIAKPQKYINTKTQTWNNACLLYTSDAADE